MGLLDGKKILVTGVLMDSSIAFHVAKIAQQEGAEVVLTSFGRTMKITQAIAKRLPTTPPVIELDASKRRGLRPARRTGPRARRRPRRGAALHRLRARGRAGRQLPQDRVGRRRHCRADLGLQPQGAGRRGPAADAQRRLGRRAHLRRHRGLAQVRLDGRGEGRVRVDRALPRPRPRSVGDPGQPRRGRTAEVHGRQGDPRLRGVRGRLGGSSAAPVGRPRLRTGRPRAASRCCPTGSRAPPARSCTSTVACTPWAPDRTPR